MARDEKRIHRLICVKFKRPIPRACSLPALAGIVIGRKVCACAIASGNTGLEVIQYTRVV
jgi:hypothetical protein